VREGEGQPGPDLLILDYTTDRSGGRLFSGWAPAGAGITVRHVVHGRDIPSPDGFTHVLHTGSALSICDDADFIPSAVDMVKKCVDMGIPQLGICYGHQLLCRALLGPAAVGRSPGGFEGGWLNVRMKGEGLNIPGVTPEVRVLLSHFDRVEKLPDKAEIIACNEHTPIQGFRDAGRRLLGLQFHPEYDREEGNKMFRKERKMLLSNGIDVDSVLRGGPSPDAGKIFFGYFFSDSWYR